MEHRKGCTLRILKALITKSEPSKAMDIAKESGQTRQHVVRVFRDYQRRGFVRCRLEFIKGNHGYRNLYAWINPKKQKEVSDYLAVECPKWGI